MEGQEYLDQISASVRPEKKKKDSSGFFRSIILKVIIGGVVAFIAIFILGSLLSGSSKAVKEKSIALKLHIDNISTIISNYQPLVKSSNLRSSSASLSSILANTSKELTERLTEKYDYKDKSVDAKTKSSEEKLLNELNEELTSAKITGNLDRVYAHKMAYEISIITMRETEIMNSTNDSTLKDLLTSSYRSLDNLYNSFNNFSETK